MPPKLNGERLKTLKSGSLKKPEKIKLTELEKLNVTAGELPAARSELLDQIAQFSPHLVALLKGPDVDLSPLPLERKNTEDLIALLEFGWVSSEIATIWQVDPGRLACWIAADDQRSARAQLARRAQAEIWDRMAFTIGLFAPNDRIEMMRAKLLMDHCKWRASMYNPDAYLNRLSIKKTADDRAGRVFTTDELRWIADGGAPPGRL